MCTKAVYSVLIFFALCFASCRSVPTPVVHPVIVAKEKPTLSPTAIVSSSPTAVAHAPNKYTSQIILRGGGRPDDMAFDQSGRVLFSDEFNATLSRVNVDGSVTVLVHDTAGPEGIVVLPNGTLVFAEQDPNQIVALAPGETTPRVLRALPGKSSNVTCKHGVDGIAFDPTTKMLIIPDSPTGDVYRMSLDGKTLTLLASGIVRPVGAGVGADGMIYIADECGHAVWSLTPSGKATRIPGFGMPDDVVPDGYGNLLVVDLEPRIHALIRLNLATGQRETLARQGFIEPQGLLIDAQGDIYISDDYANLIVKYQPA